MKNRERCPTCNCIRNTALSQSEIEEFSRLVAEGWGSKLAARRIGISEYLTGKLRKEDPSFDELFRTGLRKGKSFLHQRKGV